MNNNILYIIVQLVRLVDLLMILLIAGYIAQPVYVQESPNYIANTIRQEELANLKKDLADLKMIEEQQRQAKARFEERKRKLEDIDSSDKATHEKKLRVLELINRKEKVIDEDIEKNLREQSYLEEQIKKLTELISKGGWSIKKIEVNKDFHDDERSEIAKIFYSGRQVNQDNLLEGSYKVYQNTPCRLFLRFIIRPKSDDTADLEILLDRRGDDNANCYFTYSDPDLSNLDRFIESRRSSITIAKPND